MGKRRKPSVSWEVRRQQLADYKKEFGDTDVSQRYTKNKQFYKWIYNQKKAYKLFQEGKPSSITEERIQSLNELNFNWWKQRKSSISWEVQRQQLADYKKEVGDTNVPLGYAKNEKLDVRVSKQISQYKR